MPIQLFKTMVEQKLIKQIEEKSCVDAVGVRENSLGIVAKAWE